jgi:hypothetical protein
MRLQDAVEGRRAALMEHIAQQQIGRPSPAVSPNFEAAEAVLRDFDEHWKPLAGSTLMRLKEIRADASDRVGKLEDWVRVLLDKFKADWPSSWASRGATRGGRGL